MNYSHLYIWDTFAFVFFQFSWKHTLSYEKLIICDHTSLISKGVSFTFALIPPQPQLLFRIVLIICDISLLEVGEGNIEAGFSLGICLIIIVAWKYCCINPKPPSRKCYSCSCCFLSVLRRINPLSLQYIPCNVREIFGYEPST